MYLQGERARLSEFFGFDWYFRLAEEHGDEPGDGLSGYRLVQLPHDWSVEYPFDENHPTCGSGGYVKAGIGWYKKRFRVDGGRRGKRVSLLFDGAYMCAKVWLNGKELGDHVYGYTPFEFDITDALDYAGENEITVRIDNSFQPNSRWYTGSGITRDVWLKCVNRDHIPTYGTYITTEAVAGGDGAAGSYASSGDGAASGGSGNSSIGGDASGGSGAPGSGAYRINIATKAVLTGEAVLATTVFGSDGAERGRAQTAASPSGEPGQPVEIAQSFVLPNPDLWSAESPTLYKAVSTLMRGDTVLDEYETTFGVRTVAFDKDKGCIVNGAQVKLNGVCVHHDGGAVGAAVPAKMWRRRLMRLKAMGCNAIRCSHNPPDPALLDLCDELGFYVMDEAFDEWKLLKRKVFGSNTHESRGYSEWFNEYHVADIEAMLYRDRNHPSVVMWSIGNEVPEQTAPDGHTIAKKLQDICHRLDPTRLCTQACDQIMAEPRRATDAFLDTLDIIGYNYTGRWRTRAETLYDDDRHAHPGWLLMGAENPSAAGRRGDYRLDMPTDSWRRAYYAAPVNAGKLLRYTMAHDYVIGDFMWTGIDYLGEAHWPDRSSSSGVIDTAGFPKDHYYFYKSIWDRESPFAHVFPHRNLRDLRDAWGLDIPDGAIIPVLCYTNCEQVELFVDGKSYGKKAYSYPLYGMTETYAHWDKRPVAANTDDMFLCWDVPAGPGVIEVVGYIDGKEVYRHKVEAAGAPAALRVECDSGSLLADGRDVAHIEIAIVDANGLLHPAATNAVTVDVEGAAELIGLDNGKPDSHESFKGRTMSANGGLLLAVVRAKRGQPGGAVKVTVSADGLKSAIVELSLK
ncbi:MAG: DUF4982 domain-containing protein [Oscillospiraceae bacterium]|nr:DUF4982 domain-containing protein [Oscillospiraceae bacterium]